MMTVNQIGDTLFNLKFLRERLEEIETQIECERDKLKSHMNEIGADSLTVDGYKISYSTVESARIDAKALKAAMPDVAAQYTKVTTSKRFAITAAI